MATMAMSAATPMKTPSTVRTDRSVLRAIACAAAERIISANVQEAPRRKGADPPRVPGSPRLRAPVAAGGRVGGATLPATGPSETIRPSRMVTMRSVVAATPGLCVTTMTVTPCARLRARSTSRISSDVRESRLPVGSSARMTLGPLMSARAIATRCCWPPES